MPEVDGLIKSTTQTLRGLKPSEFPLAEPYRIKVGEGHDRQDESRRLRGGHARDKFKKETLELINALYPNKKIEAGQLFKIVE